MPHESTVARDTPYEHIGSDYGMMIKARSKSILGTDSIETNPTTPTPPATLSPFATLAPPLPPPQSMTTSATSKHSSQALI